MKHSLFTYMFAFVFLLLFSCNDEDDCNCSGEIYGKWEAVMFLSLESPGYAKNNDYNPIIEFKNDGTFSVRLDANNCSGDFELNDENGINIDGVGCTKMCCDSDFSKKFASMLPEVDTYEIEGDKLKLIVPDWGRIKLEYISN